MEFDVTFDGGLKVSAHLPGHLVATDQPDGDGGSDSATTPFNLFLASIGTCAGVYVLSFCRNHGLPTEGVHVIERVERDPANHRLSGVDLEIRVPQGFPEKYLKALERSADLCAVKRAVLDPPRFSVKAMFGA